MLKTTVVLLTMGASGCALRPVYRDLVPTSPAQAGSVTWQVVEKNTERPVALATVESGEGKSRFTAVSDSAGLIEIPVDKKRFDENAIVVLVPPPQTGRCTFRVPPAPPPVAVESDAATAHE
jgi:hypothetical protein